MAEEPCVSAETVEFGKLPDGQVVHRITLTNSNSTSVSFLSYGATLLSCSSKDRSGKAEEITLNFKSLEDLTSSKNNYYGATIGRVANRIQKGTFQLDGKKYELAVNNGPNHLHGGLKGFDKAMWTFDVVKNQSATWVHFRYTSDDMEEGYPGKVHALASYALTEADELYMIFSATTSKATPINLCNHTYWNLSGDCRATVANHELEVQASHYLPVDDNQIPTGVEPVDGTAFDLREPTVLGSRLLKVDGGGKPGFDHTFVKQWPMGSTKEATEEAKEAVSEPSQHDQPLSPPTAPSEVHPQPPLLAKVKDPNSGRAMEVYTTQPGVQIYTANWVDDEPPFVPHGAVCFETQHFPDSVNLPEFPSTILRPGAVYRQVTVHKFKCET